MSTTWRTWSAPDWAALAPVDPEVILAADLGDRYYAKQGRSTARWRLGERLTVYLKRHHHESRLSGLLAMLGGVGWSSALSEATNLRWAAGNGFAVPRVVACGESAGGWGRLRSYLAVEELTGMLPLHELVPAAFQRLPASPFARWKRGLVNELARVTRRLHGLSAFHKDLYLCHFYAAEQSVTSPPADWSGRLAMIDLHRMRRHPWTHPWWQLKDIAQLLYSSDVEGMTARDRLRFWKLYAGPARRSGWWPWFRRLVMVRWNNYRGHNAARKLAA